MHVNDELWMFDTCHLLWLVGILANTGSCAVALGLSSLTLVDLTDWESLLPKMFCSMDLQAVGKLF